MYRPNKEGEKWTHPVLGPGMQGHDRPLEFENPVMKPWMKSEVVPLVARDSDSMGWWMDEIPKTIDPQYIDIGGKGGSPYQPYEGDGMPPAFPRPQPSRMAGVIPEVAKLIATLLTG